MYYRAIGGLPVSKGDVLRYYEDHKDDIELVKQHGEPLARAMARAIERYIEIGEKEGIN